MMLSRALVVGCMVLAAPLYGASPRLEVLSWKADALEKAGEHPLEADGALTVEGVEVTFRKTRVGAFDQWEVTAANRVPQVKRLVFRVAQPLGGAGGIFWDGAALHPGVHESIHSQDKRHRFPAAAYLKEGQAIVTGFAPENLSSRFESAVNVEAGELRWDAYLALHPGQEDRQLLLTGTLPGCRDYTEVVEAFYQAWPNRFRPVEGADARLYGEGGYLWSSDATRDLQQEEARRLKLGWEWYYAPFQRAGAVYPDAATWKQEIGFNLEETPAVYDQPGGPEAWERYNRARISSANETSAVYYYYLQQYADADLLRERFPDAYWLNAEGKPYPKTFGWIKAGLWVQYAWPGETSYGHRLREDLAKAWERLPISGFALDCVIGDIRYYGEALRAEKGKAFDDQGRLYAVEGVALARNLDFTRNLPARPGGMRAASIANEAMTYHGVIHSDALMHEKPPYERADLVPLRRLLLGQKPMYWWKGFRADSLLNWEQLEPGAFREGLQGMVDYVLLTSLRFGAVPAMFFVHGYPSVGGWVEPLAHLQKAGWRAALYTRLPEAVQPANVNPYGEDAPIWQARYGTAPESWITLSSPTRERQSFPLTIETGRFGCGGAVYVDAVSGKAQGTVSPQESVVEVTLENHRPMVLEKVAEIDAPAPVKVRVERRAPSNREGEIALHFPEGFPKGTRFRFTGETAWREREAQARLPLPPRVRLQPDSDWVAQVNLGDAKEGRAAILLLPEDRPLLGARATQLAHYLEYYDIRKKAPVGRLYGLAKLRKPALVFPIVESLDAPELSKAETVFIMGPAARRLAGERVARPAKEGETLVCTRQEDGQAWVAALPGPRGENAAWGELLSLLDQRFPYHGGLEPGPMFQRFQMVGQTFEGTSAAPPSVP